MDMHKINAMYERLSASSHPTCRVPVALCSPSLPSQLHTWFQTHFLLHSVDTWSPFVPRFLHCAFASLLARMSEPCWFAIPRHFPPHYSYACFLSCFHDSSRPWFLVHGRPASNPAGEHMRANHPACRTKCFSTQISLTTMKKYLVGLASYTAQAPVQHSQQSHRCLQGRHDL